MLIAALLMQSMLLTGCTGGGVIFSTLIEKNVSISGFHVQWSDSVRHIGNLVDSTQSNSLDCGYTRSMFIGYVNKLVNLVIYNHIY